MTHVDPTYCTVPLAIAVCAAAGLDALTMRSRDPDGFVFTEVPGLLYTLDSVMHVHAPKTYPIRYCLLT